MHGTFCFVKTVAKGAHGNIEANKRQPDHSQKDDSFKIIKNTIILILK